MKCPKCGYLGFEPVERCRNCGYDFSLSPSQELPELPLRIERGALKGLADLRLAIGAQDQSDAAPVSADLPLFEVPEDAPLITRPSPPRPPLAVRRPTPESARVRFEGRMPMLDLTPPEQTANPPPSMAPASKREAVAPADTVGAAPRPPAGLSARSGAALIDLTVLALVDLVVVYFTLRICGLSTADLWMIPKTPLVAFLIVQNLGYLATFNAGGQTLGKMVAGIRVVSTDGDSPLAPTRSLLRTAVWMILAVPAGLGFLSTLTNADGRGLHDRCAGTRVIRTSTA